MSETASPPPSSDEDATQPQCPPPQYLGEHVTQGAFPPAAPMTPQGPFTYPPPANYPVPQYGYIPQPAPQTRTNGFSIAAMVLGILWLYWIGSILALVFGYIAKSQIDRSQGTQSGRGMAIAGIVLGWIGVGILGFVLVFVIIGAASAPY